MTLIPKTLGQIIADSVQGVIENHQDYCRHLPDDDPDKNSQEAVDERELWDATYEVLENGVIHIHLQDGRFFVVNTFEAPKEVQCVQSR